MSRAGLGLALLLVALLWTWHLPGQDAQAQEQPRSVEGQVSNGTSGGAAVSGLKVVFHQEGEGFHQDLETTTDAQGRFRFDGVQYRQDLFYGVSVSYQGALYGQDLDLSAGAPSPVSLTVYEATDSDEVISVASLSLLLADVDRVSQRVWALEIARIVNSSDRTYVPGPEPMKLLRFGLPAGAASLQVDTGLPGAEVMQVDRGFALIASVPPGEHEVMYGYTFPYSGSEMSITRSLLYGADYFRALAPQESMGLASMQAQKQEVVDIGGRTYRVIEASGLPRDFRLTLDLSGLPRATFTDRLRRQFNQLKGMPYEYAAPAALGLVAAGAIGFALWRRAAERRRAILAADASQAPDDERQVILRMLQDLDRSFEAGMVSEREYYQKRALLRAQLAGRSPGG